MVHIKDVVEQFLQNKKAQAHDYERISALLSNVVGPNLSQHVHIEKLYKNTLIVNTASSESRYETVLIKANILARLQQEFPHIKAIKVK